MLLFFILLLVIPCFAIKKRKADEASDILDSKSTTCIKGVLCMFVMFHNLGLDYRGNTPVMEAICEHAGGIGVGLFFFLSAFGIVRSYQKYGNKYLKKLIFKNVPRLYIISVLINLLTYFVYFKGAFTTEDTLLRIFNLDVFNDFNRMNRHGWYISTIIGMYLIFALIYFIFSKLKTDKKFIIAGILLACVAIGFRIGAMIADKGGMYTRELTAFAPGVIYATFYDKINQLFKKYFYQITFLSLLCLVITYIPSEPVATHASVILIIALSQRITYFSKTTYFLGKICLGVYLFLHFSSIALNYFITNEYLWMILNCALILGLSIMLYMCERFIFDLIKRIKERSKKKAEQ